MYHPYYVQCAVEAWPRGHLNFQPQGLVELDTSGTVSHYLGSAHASAITRTLWLPSTRTTLVAVSVPGRRCQLIDAATNSLAAAC